MTCHLVKSWFFSFCIHCVYFYLIISPQSIEKILIDRRWKRMKRKQIECPCDALATRFFDSIFEPSLRNRLALIGKGNLFTLHESSFEKVSSIFQLVWYEMFPPPSPANVSDLCIWVCEQVNDNNGLKAYSLCFQPLLLLHIVYFVRCTTYIIYSLVLFTSTSIFMRINHPCSPHPFIYSWKQSRGIKIFDLHVHHIYGWDVE